MVSQFTELHSHKPHTESEILTQQIGSQGVDLSTDMSSLSRRPADRTWKAKSRMELRNGRQLLTTKHLACHLSSVTTVTARC
jgi:hypothetical protein